MKILLEAMNPEAEHQGGTVTSMFATKQSTNPLAKRLDSLDGKTIYLVDIGFGGGHKFMQQVQNWFKENMPSVTTIRRRKTGNAFMDDTTDLWDEIKENGHAALIGVAGWPGCIAAVAACSNTLERTYGIPTVPLSTYEFAEVAKDEKSARELPFVYTPHPVISMSDDVLYSYLVGEDPATGNKVVDEIIDTLTKSVNGHKPDEAIEAVSSGELELFLEADTEDNLQRIFYERGWTDGLPIIIPTEERVNAMLAGTSATPDEVVGEYYRFDIKGMVKFTVRNVAIIAVMAGARPEHFPVILAVAATRQQAIMPSTTNFSPMLLINGPIRNEIDINCGIGAFSPVTLANSVIGRAWTLMSTCWGYMKPRKNLWSSLGSNLTYNNMCAGENEEKSVWEPFHVQHGFKAEESVVSVFRGWIISNSAGAAANRPIGEEVALQMAAIPASYTQGAVIMDPLVAKTLKETDGFATKQDFSKWLSDNIKIPAGQYWGYDHVDWMITPLANEGKEPFSSWKKLPVDAPINPYCDPDKISIVVIGGETSPLWYASDFGYSGSQSIDRWRSLDNLGECADGSCGVPDDMIEYDD